MVEITELGYIGISVSDAEAWKTYATEVIGFELVEEQGEDDRFYLVQENYAVADIWGQEMAAQGSGMALEMNR
ncbi:MAG: hypothetical protein P1U54_13585 [Immundisolibacteraceae bacterium]|nr:hypothetical protein [Immundisolibacteraceae bacterium]